MKRAAFMGVDSIDNMRSTSTMYGSMSMAALSHKSVAVIFEVALNCGVFQPAFGCFMHPKAGQTTKNQKTNWRYPLRESFSKSTSFEE